MYVNEVSMVNSLKQLVVRTTPNSCLQKDLLQEALVHLWLMETRRPDQTTSWYLQSCRFHIQHYLASGRSVDSAKRRGGQVEIASGDEDEGGLELVEADDFLFSEISTRDLLRLLAQQLSPSEKAVLDYLAEGLGVTEIGRRLNISHAMVIKHRSRIAEALARLEKPPCAAIRLPNCGFTDAQSPRELQYQNRRLATPDTANVTSGACISKAV
jgi:RNA polymerase sigma factor (sigma-70 family)